MKSITIILAMIAASAALLVAQGTTHTWVNLNTGGTLYWNQDANWTAHSRMRREPRPSSPETSPRPTPSSGLETTSRSGR